MIYMNKARKQAELSKTKASGLSVVDKVKLVDAKPPKKVGRPKRGFSDEEKAKIEQMAEDNCHMDTIALALGIPLQTLTDNFRGFISQKRAEGRTILRRAQRVKAIDSHDTGMLCFLGKNDLKQSDKIEQIHSGEISLKPPAIT